MEEIGEGEGRNLLVESAFGSVETERVEGEVEELKVKAEELKTKAEELKAQAEGLKAKTLEHCSLGWLVIKIKP
ncbi:hypothetical protein H6P81_003249 [Aristolochia fimbriata]|uniref:Uncharacterized protein n=1 Tax=Aristolochia fimbriata TaxID=158543 RepID=A0AAV7FF90_ARIFI|nr:hypothetical protein H6P81_003249 [Aristolochia fimbriata]